MRIVIIGSGNVATVLGEKIFIADHEIVQVYSRNKSHAEKLAKQTGAKAISQASELDLNADIYIIAVSDKAILEVTTWLRVNNRIVVHTAGSVPMDQLAACSTRTGILYPLQSIRKETPVLPDTPLLINAIDQSTLDEIYALARTISATVQVADDAKRSRLHAAAVMINNFSNHLFTLANDFCKNENVDFRLLIPLIREGTERLTYLQPDQLQTGPAVRGDAATINSHLQLLQNYPDLVEIYRLFTEKIGQYYEDAGAE